MFLKQREYQLWVASNDNVASSKQEDQQYKIKSMANVSRWVENQYKS